MHLQELSELIFGPPLAWRVLQVACARVYLAFSVKRLCSEGIALDICIGFVGQAYEPRWILPPVVWQNNRRMFGLISLYFSSLFPPFIFIF